MGRRKKPVALKAGEVVNLKLTKSEKRKLEKLGRKKGLGPSSLSAKIIRDYLSPRKRAAVSPQRVVVETLMDGLDDVQFSEAVDYCLASINTDFTEEHSELMPKLFEGIGLDWMFANMLWSTTCHYVRQLPSGLDREGVLRRAELFPRMSGMWRAISHAVDGTTTYDLSEFLESVLERLFGAGQWAENDLWWMYTVRGNGADDSKQRAKFEPLPSYGFHMTWKDFVQRIDDGLLSDDDGSGSLATATQVSDIDVQPSDVRIENNRAPQLHNWATHVVWFNK